MESRVQQTSRPRVLVLANQKGGVGKTTTAVNLAAGLAQVGKRVLLIDLDPQGNATMGSGLDKRSLELSVYDVLLESATIAEVRHSSPKGGYPTGAATGPIQNWLRCAHGAHLPRPHLYSTSRS